MLLAEKSINATGRTKIASYNRLRAEEERFRLGMATLNDVLMFQEDYAEAMSAEKRALTDYAKALIKAKKVTGTLLPFEAHELFGDYR
jgi:outer membrane protein TolC